MKSNPLTQQQAYRASCTHYRNGNVVHAVDGSVVFTGTRTVQKQAVPCINAAKRYVRSNQLKSYNRV